jgi:hypothetical protein
MLQKYPFHHTEAILMLNGSGKNNIPDDNINQHIQKVKDLIEKYSSLTNDQIELLKGLIEKIDNYLKSNTKWQQTKNNLKKIVLKNYPKIIDFKKIKNLGDLITNSNPVIIYLLKTDNIFRRNFKSKLNVQNPKSNGHLDTFLNELKSVKEIKNKNNEVIQVKNDELDKVLMQIINNKGVIFFSLGDKMLVFPSVFACPYINEENIEYYEKLCKHVLKCKNLKHQDFKSIIKYIETKKHCTLVPDKVTGEQIESWKGKGKGKEKEKGHFYEFKEIKLVEKNFDKNSKQDSKESEKPKKPKEPKKPKKPITVKISPFKNNKLILLCKNIMYKWENSYTENFYSLKKFHLKLRTNHNVIGYVKINLNMHARFQIHQKTISKRKKFSQEVERRLHEITNFQQLGIYCNEIKQENQYKNDKTLQQCCNDLIQNKISIIWASMNNVLSHVQIISVKNLDDLIPQLQKSEKFSKLKRTIYFGVIESEQNEVLIFDYNKDNNTKLIKTIATFGEISDEDKEDDQSNYKIMGINEGTKIAEIKYPYKLNQKLSKNLKKILLKYVEPEIPQLIKIINQNLDLIIADQQLDTVPRCFKGENINNNWQNYLSLFKLFNLRLNATKKSEAKMQLIIKLFKFLDKKSFNSEIRKKNLPKNKIREKCLRRHKLFEQKFIKVLVLMKNHKLLKEYLNGFEEVPVKLNLTSQEIFKVVRKVIKLDKIFNNFFKSLYGSLNVVQNIKTLNEQKHVKAVLQGCDEFEKYKQDYINRYVARILRLTLNINNKKNLNVARILKLTLNINNKKNLKIKFNNLLYIINNPAEKLNWCKNFEPYYNKKITTSNDLKFIAKLIKAYLKLGRFSILNDWEQLFKWLEQKTFKLKEQKITTGAEKSIVNLYSFGFVWFLSKNEEELALKLLDENKNILQLPDVLSAILGKIIRKSKEQIFSNKVWKKIIALCQAKKFNHLILKIKQQNERKLYSMLKYSNLIKKRSQIVIINAITVLKITIKNYTLPKTIKVMMEHFLPVVIYFCSRNHDKETANRINEIITFLKLDKFKINNIVNLTKRDFSLYYRMRFCNNGKSQHLPKLFYKFSKNSEHNFKIKNLFKYYSNANFLDIPEETIKCRVQLELTKDYFDKKFFFKAISAYKIYCQHCKSEAMHKKINQKPFCLIDEEQLKLFANLNSFYDKSNKIIKQITPFKKFEIFFDLIEMSEKFKKLYFIPSDKNKGDFTTCFSKYQKEKFQSLRKLNLKQKWYKITAGVVSDLLDEKMPMPVEYNKLISMIAKAIINRINLLCKNVDDYQFAACLWKYEDYQQIKKYLLSTNDESMLKSFNNAIVKLVKSCFKYSFNPHHNGGNIVTTKEFWTKAIAENKELIKNENKNKNKNQNQNQNHPYAFMFVAYIARNNIKIGGIFDKDYFDSKYQDLNAVGSILESLYCFREKKHTKISYIFTNFFYSSEKEYKYSTTAFCKNLPTFEVCNKILEQINKAISSLKDEQSRSKPKKSNVWKNIFSAQKKSTKPTNREIEAKIKDIKKLISGFEKLKQKFIKENTGIMYKLTKRCEDIKELKLEKQTEKLKNTGKKGKNYSPKKTQNYSHLDPAIEFYKKAKGRYRKVEMGYKSMTGSPMCMKKVPL